MSKLKNTKGFTDQFSEKLNLSSIQIQEIDDLEYNLFREYYWDRKNPQPNFKQQFIRQIGKILTTKQWQKLISIRDQSKLRVEVSKDDKLNKVIQSEKKRLKDLSLSEEQLSQVVKLKMEIPNLLRDELRNNLNRNIDIEEIRKKVEKEKYSTVLNGQQILKYDKIINGEQKKKLEWIIKLSSERFENIYRIKLNRDQRKDVYLIEDKSPSYNENGELYSEFEQAKFKLDSYASILNPAQYNQYKKQYQKLISSIEDRIKESDMNRTVYLDRLKKHFEYYKKNILPKTTKAVKEIEEMITDKQNAEIALLKREYLKSIKGNYSKSKEHFERFTRGLAINEEEEFKLRLKLDLISPNGYYLKNSNLVDEIIDDSLEQILNDKNKELEKEYELLIEFQKKVYEETGGEYGGGFLSKIFPTKEEEKFSKLSLLLIESNYESNIERTNAIDNKV